MEDDSQAGPDHVDAHRTEALVVSPYTQKGTVDSTLYDQDSIIRTMEMILGMKPMSLFDVPPVPMLNAFTNHPNFTAYKAEQESYPVDLKNGQQAPAAATSNAQQTPTATTSSQKNFAKPDVNEEELSREIWKATKGHAPYPEKAAKGSDKN